ncbi:hypothetical protein K435DRAFT_849771 [Dendrothele bispora CBS 962.96]|uniref:Uncharacterized protein n=1 Tax=Dendrothele bispora (strain CBS 962.96) TaxID=1314807 RepID=A0A4S8MSD8_DENBC|nr:hypothetical protein K435DRAFT_849771 [Dendrothele bispora CBS 962.96]
MSYRSSSYRRHSPPPSYDQPGVRRDDRQRNRQDQDTEMRPASPGPTTRENTSLNKTSRWIHAPTLGVVKHEGPCQACTDYCQACTDYCRHAMMAEVDANESFRKAKVDQLQFLRTLALVEGGREPTQGVGTTRNQEEERRLREERDKARDELRRAEREVDDFKEEVQKGNRSYDRLYADFKDLRRENDDLKGEVNRLRRENAHQTRPDLARTIAPIPTTTPAQARVTPTNVAETPIGPRTTRGDNRQPTTSRKVAAPNAPVQFTLTAAVKGTTAEMTEPVAGEQRERTMDVRLEETSDEESDEEEETSKKGKGKSGPKRFGRMPGPLKTLHTPGNIQRNTLKSEIIPIQMPESAAQVTELAARAQEPNNWEAVRRVQTILAVFQATNYRVKRNELQTTPSWWNVVQDLSMRWRVPGWMESAKKLKAAYNWGQDIEVLKVIKVNQANPNMSLEEQAKWMVVNATPFTHPGVLISKPRSRPANDPGVQLLPSLVIEANGKYQQMLVPMPFY